MSTEPLLKEVEVKPKAINCYDCSHRGNLAYSAHSCCNVGHKAIVEGDPHGIKRGWFYWPINFDPTWLVSCDSFEPNY